MAMKWVEDTGPNDAAGAGHWEYDSTSPDTGGGGGGYEDTIPGGGGLDTTTGGGGTDFTSGLPDWLKNIFNNPTSASGSLGITGILGALAALNEKPQTVTGSGTTNVALPDWYTKAQQAGIAEASNLPGTYQKLGALDSSGLTAEQKAALGTTSPITAYGQDTSTNVPGSIGAALAAAEKMGTKYTDTLATPADWNQTLANTTAAENVGGQNGKLANAENAITAGGGSVLDSGISKYMSPYLENVLNPQIRRLKEDQAQEQQSFDAARVARGAFGSSRADLMKGALGERQDLALNDLTSKGYESAYKDATGLSTADLARQAQMGGALSGLATTTAGINTQDISNLISTGGVIQGLDQQALDKAYGEFQRQQAALPQQAQTLQGVGQTQFNMDQSGLDKDYQTWLNNQNATIDWTKYMTGLQAQTAGQGAQNLMAENTAVNQQPFTANAAQVSAVGALKPGSSASTTQTSTGPTAGALSNLAATGSMLWGLANPQGLK